MKLIYNIFIAAACVAAVCFVTPSTLCAADDLVVYGPTPSAPSKVKIEGTSTAHDWDMNGNMIGGMFKVDPASKLDQTQTTIAGLKDGKLNAEAVAFIQVTSLKSSATIGADIMNNLYFEHMKGKEFPRILYTMTELKLKEPHAAGKPFEFDSKGKLSIAGKTNDVAMPVSIETLPENKLKITGSASFKMSSFGVEPPAPKLAIGMLKTGDDVKITYEWNLAQRQKAQAK